MVRIPDESHGLFRSGKPSRRLERLEYIVAWFDMYMGPINNYSIPIAEPAELNLKLPDKFV